MLLRGTGMRSIARSTRNPSIIVVVLLLTQLPLADSAAAESAAAEKADLEVDTLIFPDRSVSSNLGPSSTTPQRVDAMRRPGRARGFDWERSEAGEEAVEAALVDETQAVEGSTQPAAETL